MLKCESFYNHLKSKGVDFFAGVPDSLLKDICAYITDNCPQHLITANEGGAIALAAGYHLATNKIPLVYMQNSGLGNAVNPLTSLIDRKVYSIPMVLMVGWRGEPGVHDEPQHVKKGEITPDLLKILDVKTWTISPEESKAAAEIEDALVYAREHQSPVCFLIRKGTFEGYSLKKQPETHAGLLTREHAVQICAQALEDNDNAFIVSTTGMISRELYSYREDKGKRGQDFYNVGSMGHASQIALGISIADPQKDVFCFDGDGSVLMHLGGLAIIGTAGPKSLKHIIFNNGAHDSVGGQPSVGFEVNICEIARSCGYRHAMKAESADEIEAGMTTLNDCDGPALLEIRVSRGSRKDLGRPKSAPIENKRAFMESLNRGL